MSSLESTCHFQGCKRKAFIAFKCRCWKNFCSVHRYPEEHACSHLQEKKDELKAKLEKSLIRIEKDKVPNRV